MDATQEVDINEGQDSIKLVKNKPIPRSTNNIVRHADYLGREYVEIVSNPRFTSQYWIPNNKLLLTALQIYSSRIISPYLPENNRILFKVGTGAGKTLTSLYSVLPFANIFHKIYTMTGNQSRVSILGFSAPVFRREFLKYPELGIISYEEKYKLEQIEHKISNSTGNNKQRFEDERKNFLTKIRRRIDSENIGGMFSFYGYKELANNLFTTEPPKEATQANVMQMYADGQIHVNKTFLGKFKGGILIADEIHQTYNSKEINIYGLALQFLLDYYGNDISLLALSATILNNKAREIIDIANIMRTPGTTSFRSEDYFAVATSAQVAPLDPIYEAFQGKVIFLEESTKDYPELTYMGESIPGISYLKFTKCPMSPLHEQTFQNNNLYEEKTKNIMIYDMVLPNPEIPAKDIAKFHPEKWAKLSDAEKQQMSGYNGLFGKETKQLIMSASPEWRKEVGIEVKEFKDYHYFTGQFLHRSNLPIYSTKMVELLNILDRELSENAMVKILLYHPYVAEGVIQYREMLARNGYVSLGEIYNEDTFSSELHVTKREWTKQYPNKEFFPSQMATLTYDISDRQKDRMIDNFNKMDNRFGKYIQLFLGAQKIKQSVTFLHTRIEIILRCPTNISEYVQIKGRTVRNGAMTGLPPEMNNVRLYTLLSTSSASRSGTKDKPSIEQRKYKKKIEDFKAIQEIEYHINREAINNYIFYKKGFTSTDPLGAKPFTPILNVRNSGKLSVVPRQDGASVVPQQDGAWYWANNHYLLMFNDVFNLMKRAFVSNPVWTYDSLWEFCTKTKMINLDVSMAQDIFNIALKKLIFRPGQSILNMKTIVLFDAENYIIDKYYVDGVAYTMPKRVVVEKGQYYILTYVDSFGSLQFYPDSFLTKTSKTIYNSVVLNEKKMIVSENNIRKVVKKMDTMTIPEKESYGYSFMLAFPRTTHNQVMKEVVEIREGVRKGTQLPQEFISTYEKLGVLGKNWYLDEYKKNVFEKGNWEIYPMPQDTRKENPIIVGLIENESFKLRKPLLTEVYITDKRLIEKGMACTSSAKQNLEKYLAEFKISLPEKSRTQTMCQMLFKHLVDMEGKKQLRYIIF